MWVRERVGAKVHPKIRVGRWRILGLDMDKGILRLGLGLGRIVTLTHNPNLTKFPTLTSPNPDIPNPNPKYS